MTTEKKNLKVFGYGLALIISFFVWRHGAKGGYGLFSCAWLIIAGILAVITLFDYRRLKPVYDKWMVAAHCIGTVITTLILGLIFYVVFGIAGIVLRILGKDLLDRKWEPDKASYWAKREVKEFDRESYEKQF